MHLQVKVPGLRVIPISLMPKLRIESAAAAYGEGAAFRDVSFIQEEYKTDADAAVVLLEAPPVDSRLSVRLTYKGDSVLAHYGEGNYAVGARTSWYPNIGSFNDPATFSLTYHVPAGNEVVSVGRQVESKPDGDSTLYRFTSEQPVRVAGFNYGRFKRLARTDGGLLLQVFTNPGKPGFAQDIEEWIEHTKFDTGHLAEAAVADGINAARTCTHYFGPLPIQEVNITQQVQWNFGQSWPSLIYLPYLAFLDSTTRVQLGMMDITEFIEEVGPHEMAHQWWGHHIGWGSYRDQWMSEGFAEFSAVLVSQQTNGMKKYVDYFDKARGYLFKKWPGNTYANWEVGPISMGWRLPAGERQRGAYSAVVYTKGAYVLHMLRTMMRESGRPKEPGGKPTDPDAPFITMMKDFTSAWAGKEPTTADFQKVVERHMTKPMNLTGDGKMDWFFREWYEGTEIPRYKQRLSVTEAGAGRYRITGEITQGEVSSDFRMPVGLYAEFDKGRTALLARIPVAGSATVPLDFVVPLPEKPKQLRLNALADVLERD
jgi:aminopeptidase N